MPQIILYHNPQCSKSREALALLEQRNIVPVLQLYMENPPTVSELEHLLSKLGLHARDLLRTSEPAYAELKLADPALNDAQLLQVMVANPSLIQRPIAVRGNRAVVGRPPEMILELLP